MKSILFMLVFLFVVDPAGADRGPVLWHENVRLIQESQKAIILHNGTEEVLILGTELKASAEIDLLEFIPLPSEPEVGLAKGDPRGGVHRRFPSRSRSLAPASSHLFDHFLLSRSLMILCAFWFKRSGISFDYTQWDADHALR